MTLLGEQLPVTSASATSPLKILIADDHALMLAGIRRALERNEDVEIVGEARSAPELLNMVERRRPDIVLTDLRMPGVRGSECIAEIRGTCPDVKVVVLSACEDRASIEDALAAGASAYVIKSVNPADIASVLRQAASGTVFHPARGLGSVVGDVPAEEPEAPILTEREQTILAAIATGMTTAAISEELWVSEHTIKFHLTNVYRKLGVRNRAGAVRYALENGMAGASPVGSGSPAE